MTQNPNDDRWIINGAHEASKLQDQLDGYITKFVLCKKCQNPETDTVVRDGRILLDCKACGQRTEVDLRLKLSSFILKNQPKKGKGSKDKLDKKARRKLKENGDAEQNGNGHASPEGSNSDNAEEVEEVDVEAGSDDELTRRINAEARDLNGTVEEKEVEWSIDTSEEAVKARAHDLPNDFKTTLTLDDGDDEGDEGGAGNNIYDQLGSWIIGEAESKKGGVKEVDGVEIYLKCKELGIESKHKTLAVLAQTIFDENMIEEISARASMLKKVN